MFLYTFKTSTSISSMRSGRRRGSCTHRRTCPSGRGRTRSRILPATAGRFRSRSPMLLRSNGARNEFSPASETRVPNSPIKC